MKNFFSFYNELPKDSGFKIFSKDHIILILIFAIFALLLIHLYKKIDNKNKFEKGICWAIFGLEMGRYLYLLIVGEFDIEVLPLHLCSMAIYISLLNAYRPGKIKQEILYCLCMPGALSAILFPAWSVYPIISLVSIQSFIQHFLLMMYPIFILVSKRYRPDYRTVYKSLIFLLIIAPPIYIFNKIFDTNFMFINWPLPNSPLSLFADWFGEPGYIFGLFLLVIAVWIILYAPYFIKDNIKKYRET